MALNSCDVITAGLSSYACSNNATGVANLWVTNIDNISAVTISSATTNPTVTALTLTGTQKFWAMNPYQFTAEFVQGSQTGEFGNFTVTPTVRFRVAQYTTSVVQTVYKLARSKTAIIVKLNNGTYWICGLDDTSTPSNSIGMTSKKADLLSGIKSTDFGGADLELAGVSGVYAYEVASSLITSITSN